MVERTITLPAGGKKRLHVDQPRLRSNIKNGTNAPVITCQAKGGPYKAHLAEWDGPSSLVSEESQLSCGARVWIVTSAEVRLTVRE